MAAPSGTRQAGQKRRKTGRPKGKKGGRLTVDWDAISRIYIEGKVRSLTALAQQTGVSISAISQRSSLDGWKEKRDAFVPEEEKPDHWETNPATRDVQEVAPPTIDRRLRIDPGTKVKRAPGKKALPIDWDAIEREYIGGFVEKDEKGQFERRWPALRELEQRYGIGLSTLNYQSTRRNWVERRLEFQRSLQKSFDEAVAKSRGSRLDEAARMLDTFVRKFEAAIKADAVPRASIADLERALKLRQWIDSERKAGASAAGIELSDLQRRHDQVKRFVEDMDPAMTGRIPGRAEREAEAEADLEQAKADTRQRVEPLPVRRDAPPDRRSRWYQVERLTEAALRLGRLPLPLARPAA